VRLILVAAAVLVVAAGSATQPRAAQNPHRTATGGVTFETADNCVACHNGLTAPSGEDVSIGHAWSASMMANSARDPYWHAAVRRETIDHPSHGKAIEDECSTCHMPMARTAAHAAGREGEVFNWLPTRRATDAERAMAADGVSCTLCHQIGPEKLGTPESFVGGFVIAPPGPDGRRMFGPVEVKPGLARIMRSATDVVPAESTHLRQSEMCATCHTLITNAFGPEGEVIGRLPEQVPYQEWQHSAFVKERSCQSCHMPAVEATPIASVLGEPRDQMARHTFLGGNFFMLRMLNRYRDDLGVTAQPALLEAAARATERQLQSDTATLSLVSAEAGNQTLRLAVDVRNRTGHKLPTGYPSRRVWLHVTVRDSAGTAIFDSGAVAASGAIAGNDGDAQASAFEPHYEEITRPDQVQIYESVLGDVTGAPTTGLLTGVRYIKDNRLLPRGFDKRTAGADIAVHGGASADPDFTSDGDRVRYAIPLGAATGPFRIDVALRYQPIGFRWASNLRAYDAAEPRRFVSYYDAMANGSSTVLTAVSVVR
jgi:hypothetical protein